MARLGFWARIGRLISALFEGILGQSESSVSVESRLKAQVSAMEHALSARSDAAAFAMAVAQRTRNLLEKAMQEYEKYHNLAVGYARSGEDVKGKQSLLLAQRAKGEVERLTVLLSQEQTDADRQAAEYARELKEVRARAKQIPALTANARITAAEKKFQNARRGYDVDADLSSFDEIAESVHLDRFSTQAKSELERDPHAEIESEINRDAAQNALDAEYEALRSKSTVEVGEENSSELTLIEHQPNPLEAARALLEKPRFREFVETRTLTD